MKFIEEGADLEDSSTRPLCSPHLVAPCWWPQSQTVPSLPLYLLHLIFPQFTRIWVYNRWSFVERHIREVGGRQRGDHMQLMDLVVGFLFQQCSGREVCANFSQLVKPLTDWMIFLVEHSQFSKRQFSKQCGQGENCHAQHFELVIIWAKVRTQPNSSLSYYLLQHRLLLYRRMWLDRQASILGKV